MRPFRSALLVLITVAVSALSSAHASLSQPTNTVEAGIRNAIFRGDSQELRLLLEQAGKLSANDSAIAQRALVSMERIAQEEAQTLAERYGVDWANTLQHTLKTAADGPVKQALFRQYGTAENVFLRLDQAVAALRDVPQGQGKFTREIVLGGVKVVVRCFGRDGTAILRTIEKW